MSLYTVVLLSVQDYGLLAVSVCARFFVVFKKWGFHALFKTARIIFKITFFKATCSITFKLHDLINMFWASFQTSTNFSH